TDHHARGAGGDGLLGLSGHEGDLLGGVGELLGAVQEVAVLGAGADQHVHVEVWFRVAGGDQLGGPGGAGLDQLGRRGETAAGEVHAQLHAVGARVGGDLEACEVLDGDLDGDAHRSSCSVSVCRSRAV